MFASCLVGLVLINCFIAVEIDVTLLSHVGVFFHPGV